MTERFNTHLRCNEACISAVCGYSSSGTYSTDIEKVTCRDCLAVVEYVRTECSGGIVHLHAQNKGIERIPSVCNSWGRMDSFDSNLERVDCPGCLSLVRDSRCDDCGRAAAVQCYPSGKYLCRTHWEKRNYGSDHLWGRENSPMCGAPSGSGVGLFKSLEHVNCQRCLALVASPPLSWPSPNPSPVAAPFWAYEVLVNLGKWFRQLGYELTTHMHGKSPRSAVCDWIGVADRYGKTSKYPADVNCSRCIAALRLYGEDAPVSRNLPEGLPHPNPVQDPNGDDVAE